LEGQEKEKITVMTDLHDAHDLEDLYGPLYRYSDHKRGERIAYREAGKEIQTGEILWVCAPGPVVEGGRSLPAHYMVANDNTDIDWPDTVYSGEIVVERQVPTDGPTLTKCPYCNQLQLATHVAHCPLKPH
jgi:hypothetical protein